MSRKDYVQFAALLATLKWGYANRADMPLSPLELITVSDVLSRVENGIVNILSRDNPNFDESRFRKASKGE